jgi:hypothetical protein
VAVWFIAKFELHLNCFKNVNSNSKPSSAHILGRLAEIPTSFFKKLKKRNEKEYLFNGTRIVDQ